jgi:5,6-dimethylbenzimidazole synthase
MQIDSFLELVKTRRCCRAFKPDPIPDDYIEKILEAARWAMSGANGQPWEFIVVKDRETRNQILDIYSTYQNEKWYMEQTRIEELRTASSPSTGPSVNRPDVIGFREAPVIIVVCGDPRTLQTSVVGGTYLACEGGFDAIYFKNMANATQILHLAVAACGISSGWVSVSYMIEGRLKKLLNVPDQIAIPTLVPIGYPAHPPTPPYRRELKEIMHSEKYDRSKFRTSEDVIDFIRNIKRRKRSPTIS